MGSVDPTLKALRDANARLIAEAPVVITIHRLELPEGEAGGRSKIESDLPPITGRLVPSRRQGQGNQNQNEAGAQQRDAWILIAPWNADLKHGTDVTDTFEAQGRLWKVVRAYARRWKGQPYAVHAAVEEVS